jgi:hypothetical protein
MNEHVFNSADKDIDIGKVLMVLSLIVKVTMYRLYELLFVQCEIHQYAHSTKSVVSWVNVSFVIQI